MRRRTAWKILATDNYYEVLENPENGKTCCVPKSQKHVNLMIHACEKLKRMDVYDAMTKGIGEAFED